jgi:hypothetical protein
MKIPRDLGELTALFEKYGAPDPEGWARSQLDEGIPQLQRFLFLRQAWSLIVRDGDTDWIQAAIRHAEQHPDSPFAGGGHALRRCLDKGVSPQDLTEIVRSNQAELLFQFCYLLDDPAFPEEELSELAWGLFQVDEEGNPMPTRIQSLYESVLETDPAGREMRPREGQ